MKQIKRIKVLFAEYDRQTFIVILAILILSRIFFFEWIALVYSHYFFLIIFLNILLLCLFLLSCYISMVVLAFLFIRRKKCIPLLLLILLLFLPLTSSYENFRFRALRPTMEKVATEVALDRQYDDSGINGSLELRLPLQYCYLSRFGYINLAATPSGFKVAFNKYWGIIFTRYREYVFQTSIPYLGPPEYVRPYPHPDYIMEEKQIAKNWVFVEKASFGEGLAISGI